MKKKSIYEMTPKEIDELNHKNRRRRQRMDKLKYYQFWLYQYVKRNQEYIDAFNLITDPNTHNGRPGLSEASKLVRSFGFMDPNIDAYRKDKFCRPWIRDEVSGLAYYSEKSQLTSKEILETLLTINDSQGCQGNAAIKCNYIVRVSSFANGQEPEAPLPKEEELKRMPPEEIAQAYKFYQAIETERVDNFFYNTCEDRRTIPYSLSRALGLALYELFIDEKSKANAVIAFLAIYGDINGSEGDRRVPASYRKNKDDNLYKLLNKTIDCINSRDVLPMS